MLRQAGSDFSLSGPQDGGAPRGRADRAAHRAGRRRSLRQLPGGGHRHGRSTAPASRCAIPRTSPAVRPRSSSAGGVAANQAMRRGLQRLATEAGLQLVMPAAGLCTDNGAMIAWAGARAAAARSDRRSRRSPPAPAGRWTNHGRRDERRERHESRSSAAAPGARRSPMRRRRPARRDALGPRPGLGAGVRDTRENARHLPGIRLHDAVRITAEFADAAEAGAVLVVMPAQCDPRGARALAPLLASPRRWCSARRESSAARSVHERDRSRRAPRRARRHPFRSEFRQ